jgi:hypothetical protein
MRTTIPSCGTARWEVVRKPARFDQSHHVQHDRYDKCDQAGRKMEAPLRMAIWMV